MKVRRFNPADDLIIVKARLYGPRGDRPLLLAFDTAATETHIVPEIIDDLGYSPRQGEAITSVRSAIGKERGYMLRVTRFASFGFSFPDFVVHVHDLPRGIRHRWPAGPQLSPSLQLRGAVARRSDSHRPNR
jgi:hypothetical protein